MSFPEPFDDGKDLRPNRSYDSDPARIRSLLRILEALWERHPNLQLMELLESLGPTRPFDADLSDRITRRLNAELAEEMKLK